MRWTFKKGSDTAEMCDQPHDATSYKLFLLNLHRAVACAFELQQVFHDLREVSEGDYFYGEGFITESVGRVMETLDKLSFHLNTLSNGRDVDLFLVLDRLKNRLNEHLRSGISRETGAAGGNAVTSPPDDPSVFLRRAVDLIVKPNLPANAALDDSWAEKATALDLLIYCYHRLFEILDCCLEPAMSANREPQSRSACIVAIPVGYFDQGSEPGLQSEPDGDRSLDEMYACPGADGLRDGICEVLDSYLYGSLSTDTEQHAGCRGALIHSNDALALYYLTERFRNVVAANVCDAVGGNCIHVLIGPARPGGISAASFRLARELLDWLDFHTFSTDGFTVASIRNMTRERTENHLNLVGKLLSFISSPGVTALHVEGVQQNVELFLESVV